MVSIVHYSDCSNMKEKVQVGKDQEKAQSEKDSHSKNRGGKKANQQSGMSKLMRVMFDAKYYPQLGLLSDDMYLDRDKEVKEAIRRLPKQLYDERQARQTRALYLDARKQILPRSQWTKPEEDVPYLKPYLDEVQRENQEKKDWKNLTLTWKKGK